MRHFILAAALSTLSLPAIADDAAVLLGVDNYDDLRPVSGGDDIMRAADELREAGYDVVALDDASANAMKRALIPFAEEAALGDRLVVALSGRFATDENRTWFLSQDAQSPGAFAMERAISVDTVLQILSRAPGEAILLLGYQQSNFASFGPYLREGVGRLDVPQGVTVIYGEPNRMDDALIDAITNPGGDVMAYVRENSRVQMLGFQPNSLIMQPRAAPAGGDTTPLIEPSLRDWNDAQEANTAASYRAFLAEHPRSPYAAEARDRLDDIESDPIRLAELAEDALNLTRNERREVQSDLTLLDFNTRGVDGIFGPGSRGAIRNWQQENGFAQTSYLTQEQINRIDAQASRRTAEIEAEEERAREEALRLDRAYWEETGARGDQAGFRAYLERYPEGIFADQARAGLAPVVDESAAQAAEEALQINPVLRRLIETRLGALGYNVGRVDGRFDNNARRAIAAYQEDSNITPSGYIDQQTLARLLADTFGR